MLNRTLVPARLGVAEAATIARRAAPALLSRMAEDVKRPIARAPRTPQVKAWPETGLHAAWVGHSTVVLGVEGFLIVTDPVLSARIGIRVGPLTLGLKRLVAPAIPFSGLPAPHLILLSHAHMDHFDLPTLRRLERRGTTVITARNTSDLLRVRRYGLVRELDWNEATQAGPAKVRAFEVKHWGARVRSDTYRGYNGYVIEVGRYRILFGGDTAYTNSFRQLRSSKPVDLAIMPIGAYDPWVRAHCNPEQALSMANDAGAEFVLPVHHRTFRLSREPLLEPIERLLSAAGSSSERICIRDFGQEFHAAC